jgi:hypothetical protein
MIRRPIAAGVMVLCICGGGTAWAKSGVWSAPRAIVAGPPYANDYAVAMSAKGEAIAAWTDLSGVHVSVARPGRGFSPPQRLARLATAIPSRMIAVNRRGDAIVVWTVANASRRSGLYAAYRRAGRSFGKPERISGNGVGADFALDARGDATFVWQRLEGRRRGPATLEVVERAPNGRLRRVQALQAGVGEMVPSVAVNGRDDATVAWVSGSLSQARVWCATRRHGGRFGPPTAVTPATGATSPSVGLDDAGRALIAWDGTYTGAAEGFPYATVDTATVRVGSLAPSAGRQLAGASAGGLVESGPTVRMNSSGQALVTWEHYGSSALAHARIRVARTAWGHAPRVVATLLTSEPDQNISSAIGSRGEAVIAWTNLGSPDKASVAPGARSQFAPPKPISARGRAAGPPEVAIDQRGDAIAVWLDLGPIKPTTPGSTRDPLLYATAVLR